MPDQCPICPMQSVFAQIAGVFREAGRIAWGWKWYYLAALVLTAPLLFLLMHFDAALLATIRLPESETANSVAGKLSRIGKTDGVTLWLSMALLLVGIFTKRTRFTRAGLCLVCAVIVSGIGVNVLRPSFGRARPYSENAGTFHPISANHEFNSFPSGHSSEAWTVATVISIAFPPAAVPACAYAGSMMWARMQRAQHFPADVLGGMIWGILCALPFAVQLRKKPLSCDIQA